MKKTQNELILDALQRGDNITPIDALRHWNCFRLGARIWDLKRAGIPVSEERIKQDGKQFSCYFLKPEFRSLKPNFKRKGGQDSLKQSDKVNIRRDVHGRFKSINQSVNQKVFTKAEEFYVKTGKPVAFVAVEFGIPYETLRVQLKQRGVLRHRGQQKMDFANTITGARQ